VCTVRVSAAAAGTSVCHSRRKVRHAAINPNLPGSDISGKALSILTILKEFKLPTPKAQIQ